MTEETLSKQEKIGFNLFKSFYNYSHSSKNKYLNNFIYNVNFRNNQNYVLGKNLKNAFLSAKNITENGRNMIGYNSRLKLQEIDINKLRKKRNFLKIFLFGFAIIFLTTAYLGSKQDGDFSGFLISIVFFSIFIPPWFISFGKNKFILLKNRDKLIIIQK